MKIVTVSREFGSGGRELGKRLADVMGFSYYDREIITAIAEKGQFNEQYVAETLERGMIPHYPVVFGRTFSYPIALQQEATKVFVLEQQIIKALADQGKDFLIVGRSADIILRDYGPFNLFVYADMEAKIKRCNERGTDGEQLTANQMAKKIKQIDSNRAKHREFLTNSKWGQKESYHLCINTTDLIIKDLSLLMTEHIKYWFRRNIK